MYLFPNIFFLFAVHKKNWGLKFRETFEKQKKDTKYLQKFVDSSLKQVIRLCQIVSWPTWIFNSWAFKSSMEINFCHKMPKLQIDSIYKLQLEFRHVLLKLQNSIAVRAETLSLTFQKISALAKPDLSGNESALQFWLRWSSSHPKLLFLCMPIKNYFDTF